MHLLDKHDSSDLNGARKVALSFLKLDKSGQQALNMLISLRLAPYRQGLECEQRNEGYHGKTTLHQEGREDLIKGQSMLVVS